MKTIILSVPAVEPVTLDEVKDQLRIDNTIDDDYLNALISAARNRCEDYCNQFFTIRDIALVTTASLITELPYPNLTITSVEVDDIVVTEFTYDSDTQILTLDSSGGKLKIYATTAVPIELNGVQQSIKIIVTDLYETRTESVLGVSVSENLALKAMLYPYRLSLSI